jgi:hypothetical protein
MSWLDRWQKDRGGRDYEQYGALAARSFNRQRDWADRLAEMPAQRAVFVRAARLA